MPPQSFLANLWLWTLYNIDAIIHSGLPLFFWVRPSFSTASIPNLTGKVVIVTGGNSGTGFETCKTLYEHGATVYMASRNVEKAKTAIETIENDGIFGIDGISFPSRKSMNGSGKKGGLEYLQLDLADLGSVQKAAEEFGRREKRLDLLFANAGIMASPEGLHTKQGYTLQFGTNCLGHHRLITLLLPLLLSTSRTNPSDPPRIITTSSAGHGLAPAIGFNPLSVVRVPGDADGKRGKNEYSKWTEYGQSKWGDIALVRWLHWVYGPDEGLKKEVVQVEKVGGGEIISISIHPGFVATNLAQHLFLTPYVLKWAPSLISMITQSPATGALNQIWAGTCSVPEAKRLSGAYIMPFQKVGTARPDLNDAERVSSLWKWCDEQARRSQ